MVRTFSPGETAAFGASRVHAVANRGAAVATSVHVYSPPLSSMKYYRPDDSGSLVAVEKISAAGTRFTRSLVASSPRTLAERVPGLPLSEG